MEQQPAPTAYTLEDISLISQKLTDSDQVRFNEAELFKTELVKTLTTFRDNGVDIGGFVGLLQMLQLVRSDLRDLSGAVAILASFLSRDLEKKKEAKRLRDKLRKEEIKRKARMEALFVSPGDDVPPPSNPNFDATGFMRLDILDTL
jgi:hypothetical protein